MWRRCLLHPRDASGKGDSATPDARTEVSHSPTWNATTQSVAAIGAKLPGLHPPSSLSSKSDEGGSPGTGLWYKGEWWSYDDIDGNGDGDGDGTAGDWRWRWRVRGR